MATIAQQAIHLRFMGILPAQRIVALPMIVFLNLRPASV
jgi:hypothetical protein